MAKTTTEETAVAANDAYTGMLAISLVALIIGCVFVYLDWSNYQGAVPPKTVKVGAPAPAVNAPPVVPANPPAVNPMAPPMAPMPPVENPAEKK